MSHPQGAFLNGKLAPTPPSVTGLAIPRRCLYAGEERRPTSHIAPLMPTVGLGTLPLNGGQSADVEEMRGNNPVAQSAEAKKILPGATGAKVGCPSCVNSQIYGK